MFETLDQHIKEYEERIKTKSAMRRTKQGESSHYLEMELYGEREFLDGLKRAKQHVRKDIAALKGGNSRLKRRGDDTPVVVYEVDP